MNKIVLLLFLLYSIGSTSQENYETLRIPIVFHVIDHSIKDGDIPDQEFEKLVQLLNRNFSEPNSTYISPIYFPKARNTKIKFYIPSKTKNCEIIDPITWTHTNQKHYKFNDDFPLIDVHQPRLENKNFLNVYLVRIGSEKGSLNGYYKSSTSLGEEGIVLDWTLLYRPQENLYGQPNSVTQGVKTLNPMAFALSHEIGHFFNLKHTWGAKAILFNGCNHQTQYVFGDFVDDTPPQPGPNEAYKKDRFNPTNKLWSPLPNCGTSTPSNYQNFMDYGYGAPNGFGMFTEGQVIRMRDYIDNKKQSLIWKENCKEAPSPTTGFFKDNRNNKSYKWVQIGSQKWMTKNLNYKTENSTCYNNNESNCTIYGRLYNWNEAMTACPDGWRLPKTQDWKQMAESVSYNLSTIKSSEGWIKDNGSNYRELNILPSGYYTVTRRFRGLGQRASFWLADDLGNNVNRNSRTIRDGFNQIPTSGINFAREKLSCRCIQDIDSNSQFSSNNNIQILSETKLRDKLGAPFNFSQKLPFNTNIDLTLKGFFEREIKVSFTSENLEKIGLKIIGTDKFKDLVSGKTVSQDYIYKYLDIEKTRLIANRVFPKNHVNSNKSETNLSIGIENRRQQKVKLVLLNKKTNKEDVFIVDKVYRTYLSPNSVRVLWVKLPKGNYSSKVYLQSNNKLISSTDLTLTKNNQLITIKAD